MASSPATAMAGPVPAPVEASGAAPAAWAVVRGARGLRGGRGLGRVRRLGRGRPGPSPPALLPPPLPGSVAEEPPLAWYSNVQVTAVPPLEAVNTSFEPDSVLSSFQSDGTSEILILAPAATL